MSISKSGKLSLPVLVLAAALLSMGPAPGAQAAAPVSEFSGYLAQGYHQLATVAGKTKSAAATLYKQRGVAAAGGHAVLPLQPDPKKLDGLLFGEATAARADLMESLGMAARERQPLLAAIAQVNFDCWVVPLPKHKGVPTANDCQSRFYFALAGLPAKKRRAPIASVEVWQVADAPAGTVVATAASSVAAAAQVDDPIGSLIRSLSGPSGAATGKSFDPALASVVIVNSDLPPVPPAGKSTAASVVVGSCEGQCMAMDFIGPGAPPLIQALSDPDIFGLHRQRSDGGEQVAGGGGSASAGSGSGTGGTGTGGSATGGTGTGGTGTGGSGTGGTGTGGTGSGTSGGSGTGGDSGNGDGSNGGSSHGHGHHNGG